MATEIATGELLELRAEAGGLRYYLAGKSIHAGELLELLLDDGSWALGRFEWSYRKEDWPGFFLPFKTFENGDHVSRSSQILTGGLGAFLPALACQENASRPRELLAHHSTAATPSRHPGFLTSTRWMRQLSGSDYTVVGPPSFVA